MEVIFENYYTKERLNIGDRVRLLGRGIGTVVGIRSKGRHHEWAIATVERDCPITDFAYVLQSDGTTQPTRIPARFFEVYTHSDYIKLPKTP